MFYFRSIAMSTQKEQKGFLLALSPKAYPALVESHRCVTLLPFRQNLTRVYAPFIISTQGEAQSPNHGQAQLDR
jgi:hypothetical protein